MDTNKIKQLLQFALLNLESIRCNFTFCDGDATELKHMITCQVCGATHYVLEAKKELEKGDKK